MIVTGGQLPRRLDSRSVTANFFGVLGATPFQGRLFDQSDARPDAAVDGRRQLRLRDAGVRQRAGRDRADGLAESPDHTPSSASCLQGFVT